MLQKESIAKKDYTAIGEEISHEMAADFIRNFDRECPNETKGFTMGKNILQQILSQPGCAGMRFYNGINEHGQKTLVYVGVDTEGKDLVRKTVVLEDGSLASVRATIADRNDNTDDTLTFGDIMRIIFGY
jgi:hypothetical protein